MNKVLHLTDCTSGGVPAVVAHLMSADESHAVFLGQPPAGFPFAERMVALDRGGRSLNPVRVARRLLGLARVLRQHRPDVLHAHSSFAGFYAAMLRPVWRGRVIYTPHASPRLDPTPGLLGRVLRGLEHVSCAAADLVLACSPDEARVLERTPLATRVLVLPNGVPELAPAPPDAAVRGHDVVAVGRACLQKDPQMFARIAHLVRQRDPGVRFAWIGGGKLPGIEHADAVDWLGPRSEAQVERALLDAHVFVSTSRYEGLSLAALKAAAAGCALVLRDTPGTRAPAELGAEAQLFVHEKQAADAVLALLALHEGTASQRTHRRDQAAQRFSLRRQLHRTRRLYNALTVR